MLSVFLGIAPVIVVRCSVDLIFLVIGCPLVSIDSHRFIYFRCPWKYICCGLTVEVSSLACPWKYICCGLTVEVSLLACTWKYLRWPARGSIVGGLPVEVSVLAYPRKYLCWLARGSFFAGLPLGVSLLWPARGSIVAVACP